MMFRDEVAGEREEKLIAVLEKLVEKSPIHVYLHGK